MLKAVIDEYGPSSETNGLLGRVYKDRWEGQEEGNGTLPARGFLKHAVESYPPDSRPIGATPSRRQCGHADGTHGQAAVEQEEILPVVRYAASQKVKRSADYWDYATLLELAVLGRDMDGAIEHLGDALAKVVEGWQLSTTERNLRLIRETRAARGERHSLDRQGSGGRTGGEARTR